VRKRWFGRCSKPLIVLAAAWLLVALPPLGALLERTMVGQMLVQIALLVVIGLDLGRRMLTQHPGLLRAVRPYRWGLLIVAIVTLAVWMIPRMLDLAVASGAVDLAKACSLTLLAGLPLSLAWRAFGPVVRGLLHVEALATLARLGWLYVDSPTRLCTQYGWGDQVRLGHALLAVGVIYVVWLVSRALGADLRDAQPCDR